MSTFVGGVWTAALAWAGPNDRSLSTTPYFVGPALDAPAAMGLLDLDGDGDQDVVVAQFDYNYRRTSRLYRNDGDGTLTEVAELNGEYRGVATGDYDGDGDPDLVMAGDDQTDVWRNDGGALVLAWTGPGGRDVDWADVDGDGDLDLALARDWRTNLIFTQRNGVFTQVWASANAEDSQTVAWVDIDNDGVPELSWGNSRTGPPSHVDRVVGQALVPVWTDPQNRGANAQVWADFDGDGFLDVAFLGSSLFRLRNLGNGNFQQVSTQSWPALVAGLAAGDDGGDGDVDLLVPRSGTGDALLVNDGTGDLVERWTSRVAAFTQDLAFLELNGDGVLDHVHVSFDGVATYLGGEAGLVCDDRVQTSLIPGGGGGAMAFGDLDGDGDPDLTMASQSRMEVWDNAGSRLGPAWDTRALVSRTAVRHSDVDLDGDLDLIVTANGDANADYNPESTQVWSNDGTGSFTRTQTLTSEGSTDLDVADVDGDGDEDLLVSNWNQCTWCTDGKERLYRNDSGTFVSAWRGTNRDDTYTVRFADADGDGDPDFYAGNFGNDELYLNDGTGNFVSVWRAPDADASDEVAWGDFDGDGDLDVAASSNATGPRVYENVGGGLVESWTQPTDAPTPAMAAGDWNGDGRLDLASGGSTWFVGGPIVNAPLRVQTLGRNHTWTTLYERTDLVPDEMGFQDLDGDGRTELVMNGLGVLTVLDAADTDGDGELDACESLQVERPSPLEGVADVVVLNTWPQATVHVVGSTRLGSTAVPGCPGLSVGLRNPSILTTEVADTTGEWSGTFPVPANLPSGTRAYLQAVDAGNCLVGDPIEVVVP